MIKYRAVADQHRRRVAPLAVALVLAVVATADTAAQQVEDFVGAYQGSNAQGFFGPLAKGLTANLNAGFAGPVVPTRGFSLRIGLVGGMASFTDAQRTFTATTEPGFRPGSTQSVPTIVGSAQAVQVEGEGGSSYIFPAGLEIQRIGLVMPQLTVGSVLGTEATVRAIAIPLNDELGDVSLFGGGLRHNISQYLPFMPVDLGLGGMYNRLKLGDTVDMEALLVTVMASRRVLGFDFYGGLGWEQSSLKLAYDSESAESGRVTTDMDGVSGIRGTAGVRLSLPLIAFTADLNLGSQTVLGMGLSVGTRY